MTLTSVLPATFPNPFASATLGFDSHCHCQRPAASDLLPLHLQEMLLQEEEKQEGEGQGEKE